MILFINLISIKLILESYELFIFFLNWELFNISLYIFIVSDFESFKSLSVGFKYYLLSALNTSFLLLGILLLYSEIGNLQYDNILLFFNISNSYLAIFFISITFLFKLSAIPFHNWSPD
jgi:NADH-quinone oxidoreductase subunit N